MKDFITFCSTNGHHSVLGTIDIHRPEFLSCMSSDGILELSAHAKAWQASRELSVIPLDCQQWHWADRSTSLLIILQAVGISVAIPCLSFFTEEWQAPLEYEGDNGANPICNLWSLKCLSSDDHHSLLLMTFAEASRAIAPGELMKDVSEIVEICENEPTIACGEIAEGFFVQTTTSQVRCCSLLDIQGEFELSFQT